MFNKYLTKDPSKWRYTESRTLVKSPVIFDDPGLQALLIIKYRELQHQILIFKFSICILIISLNIADILKNTVNPPVDGDPDTDKDLMDQRTVGAGVVPVMGETKPAIL